MLIHVTCQLFNKVCEILSIICPIFIGVFGSFGLSTKEPYTIIICLSCIGIGVGICAHLPWYRVRHKNFIFGTNMHICPPYMHIKYLVILTCSFKWQPFWYFSLICYPAQKDSHRDFISHT